MLSNRKDLSDRAIRGYSILAKGDMPKLVNEEMFLVPSQSSSKKYRVVLRKAWTCDCADFKYRKQKCKHIHAVEFLLKMRQKVADDKLELPSENIYEITCEYCKSEDVIKYGTIKNKEQNKQRYLCRNCKKTFYQDSEFNGLKANPKIVVLTMDLYYKGLSLREISDTLFQFYNLKISHETIRRWISKFSEAINEYTGKLTPKVSDAWHLDEQAIKSKGKEKWLWNMIDSHTRFLIANNITDSRYISDAREVLQKSKETAKENPEFIITDGLWAYEKAIVKEFPTWRIPSTKHIRLATIRAKRNNNLVERFHGTFRERDKVMRGFKGGETVFADGFRNYYNFIRPHFSLNGQTPSQVANIDLQLDRNRWLSLVRKAHQ